MRPPAERVALNDLVSLCLAQKAVKTARTKSRRGLPGICSPGIIQHLNSVIHLSGIDMQYNVERDPYAYLREGVSYANHQPADATYRMDAIRPGFHRRLPAIDPSTARRDHQHPDPAGGAGRHLFRRAWRQGRHSSRVRHSVTHLQFSPWRSARISHTIRNTDTAESRHTGAVTAAPTKRYGNSIPTAPRIIRQSWQIQQVRRAIGALTGRTTSLG